MIAKKNRRNDYVLTVCPGEDSNLHARKSTGPQPAAYANSATWAGLRPLALELDNYSNSCLAVNGVPVDENGRLLALPHHAISSV